MVKCYSQTGLKLRECVSLKLNKTVSPVSVVLIFQKHFNSSLCAVFHFCFVHGRSLRLSVLLPVD